MAISVLMVILTGLLLANTFIGSNSPFGKGYYQKLDKQFQKRTAALKDKEQSILARYQGSEPAKMRWEPTRRIQQHY